MATCDFTDLPMEQCAHCRGLALDTKERADGWTRARYAARCPNCGARIEPGDMIGAVGAQQWWGECCAE